MKHLHLLMAVITIALFLYQAMIVFTKGQLSLSSAFKAMSHVVYLLLVVSGLYLLWQLWQVAGAQHWALAKMVLLIVAISANVKALRHPALNQKKAGMLIAGVAYAGILILAIAKPIL